MDDCGGGYSESIAEMCEELTETDRRQMLPLFIETPNGRDQMGANQDCLVLNPSPKLSVSSYQNQELFTSLPSPLIFSPPLETYQISMLFLGERKWFS